jgi:methylphosphotriester-DNA--protein-cysteine methyltransferase
LPKSAKLKLERVTALLAQKGKPTNLGSVIESALDEYLKHHDPIEKARRAEARAARRCEVPHQNFDANAKCVEERAALKGQTSRDGLDREAKRVKERAALSRQIFGDGLNKETKCAEERLANEKSLSHHALVQSQQSRLGQESKPSQVPALNQAPRLEQGFVRGESPMKEWELALDQGSALRQGSRCENTWRVSPSRSLDSISSPGSILSPVPNPDHGPCINNEYLLRTRRVFTETQVAQSDYSPGGDLTKLNLSTTKSQNLVADQKFALNRSRDLSQKHTPSHTHGAAPHRRPLQNHISSPKQPLRHKPGSCRRPLSASEKHAVFLRDEGRCTFVNERGERCGADRYLHVHHIKMVSHGGTNELSNTTTLCAAHHDLVHQLSLPIEGQINWLRAPVAEYVA